MGDGGFIQRGGWWVVAQNALTLAVFALAPLFRARWKLAAISTAGGVLLSIGGCLGIAGVCALGRNLTPYPKPLKDSRLVQGGVYAVARHPPHMFASVGWALLWASGAALVSAGVLTLVLRAKAMREERWLRDRYPEYRDYEQRVKRFVPGLW
jgi:protein-S-isoprenylcysteine O-methyltransferase Ste14